MHARKQLLLTRVAPFQGGGCLHSQAIIPELLPCSRPRLCSTTDVSPAQFRIFLQAMMPELRASIEKGISFAKESS